MSTTKDDIRDWLERGKEEGARFMIVVCDTFDHEDYPVFVQQESYFKEVEARYDGTNMQRIMEVYDLSMDFEEQLSQNRSWNGPK